MNAVLRLGFAAVVMILVESAAGTAQGALTVRVATPPFDSGAQAFFATDKGFFKRAGLQVDLTVLGSSAIAPAIASGTVDIAQSTIATLASAREHGQPFVVFAPSTIFSVKVPSTAGIVVGKNFSMRTGRDFNGKTVAVSQLQGIAQVTVENWIDKTGGDSTTVKFIEIPPAAMTAALESGRVDAIETVEPFLDEAIRAGQHNLTSGYEAVANEFAIGAWYCTSSYASSHPEVLRRYAQAMAESARWANRNPREASEILAKWTKQQLSATIPPSLYGERLTPALIQPLIDVSAKYRTLKATFPAEEMIAPGMSGK